MSAYLSLLSAAGSKPPPLVDIDATIFVQFGIFLLLLLVLTRAVFKPYLALRAERSRSIEGAREEALQLDQDARAKLETYERQILAARKEAAAGRLGCRQEGETKAAALLEDARHRAEESLQAARHKLEKSTEAAELSMRTRADTIARIAASKLLGREV
jgi:F-type H+-transporting ATPase subunit b